MSQICEWYQHWREKQSKEWAIKLKWKLVLTVPLQQPEPLDGKRLAIANQATWRSEYGSCKPASTHAISQSCKTLWSTHFFRKTHGVKKAARVRLSRSRNSTIVAWPYKLAHLCCYGRWVVHTFISSFLHMINSWLADYFITAANMCMPKIPMREVE